MWIRHCAIKHKLSHSTGGQDIIKENSAYHVIPLGYTAEAPKKDAVIYEDIKTMSSDTERHQYEIMDATNQNTCL
jgi:hypothetical protein